MLKLLERQQALHVKREMRWRLVKEQWQWVAE